jgi:hypothetical protein
MTKKISSVNKFFFRFDVRKQIVGSKEQLEHNELIWF